MAPHAPQSAMPPAAPTPQTPPTPEQLNAAVVALIRQQAEGNRQEVAFMEKKFLVFPEVFYASALRHVLEAMAHSALKIVSDELATRDPSTPFEILEIGPGVGHFMICAASLAPQVQVTGVDINPAAVANVVANAALHGVAQRVQCAVGDVYNAPVTRGKTFDLIYWDPPLSKGDPALATQTSLERAVWDPDSHGLTQYIARAREFLKPGGRLLLAWNHFFGDGAALASLATQHGWALQAYGSVHFPVGPAYLTFISYELR